MKQTTDWIFTYPDSLSRGGHIWKKVPDMYFNKKHNKMIYTSKVFFRNGVEQNFERNIPVEQRQLIVQSVKGLSDLFYHYTGRRVTTTNYFVLRSLFYQHIYRNFDPEQVINDARDLIGKTIYEDPLQLQIMFEENTRQKRIEDKMYKEYLMCRPETLDTLIQMEEHKEFIDWPKYNAMRKAFAELKQKGE
jgi:hypothetical protein